MHKKQKQFLLDYSLIALGTLFLALGINLFLVPLKLSTGGISSIGTVLLYLFQIPISVTNMVLNVLLLLCGYRFLGRGAALKTLAGIALLSLFLQLTEYLPIYTADRLIATLIAGILLGVGVGLAVRQGASTGGSDLAALMLHRAFPHISVASFIMWIDCAIILGAALVFKSVTVAGYSLLCLFIATKVTDGILTLGDTAKAVQIISKNHAAIAAEIMEKSKRGVTGYHTTGLYTGTEGLALMCVVSPKELPPLIRRVREADPAAFIIISDAREVLGEGFKSGTAYDL